MEVIKLLNGYYGSEQNKVSYRISKGGLKYFMGTLGVELAPLESELVCLHQIYLKIGKLIILY